MKKGARDFAYRWLVRIRTILIRPARRCMRSSFNIRRGVKSANHWLYRQWRAGLVRLSRVVAAPQASPARPATEADIVKMRAGICLRRNSLS